MAIANRDYKESLATRFLNKFNIVESLSPQMKKNLELMRKNRSALDRLGFHWDNPLGGWLESERNYAGGSKRRTAGTLTASLGMVYGSKRLYIKTKYLEGIPGANKEEHHRHDKSNIKYSSLAKSIAKKGWKPDWSIMIWVGHNGQYELAEGNHRWSFAYANGIEWIPVDIRYYAGGELADGKFSPIRLLKRKVLSTTAKSVLKK